MIGRNLINFPETPGQIIKGVNAAQVVRTDTANVTATFNVAPGANSSATPPSIIAMVTKID